MPIHPCATCGMPADVPPHAPGQRPAAADCGRHDVKPKARAKKVDTDAASAE